MVQPGGPLAALLLVVGMAVADEDGVFRSGGEETGVLMSQEVLFYEAID